MTLNVVFTEFSVVNCGYPVRDQDSQDFNRVGQPILIDLLRKYPLHPRDLTLTGLYFVDHHYKGGEVK